MIYLLIIAFINLTSSKYVKQTGSAESTYRSFALGMLFCAVGRSGEVATASWDSARWCNINKNLILNWSELKTGDSDPMNFFPDFDTFEIDFYFQLAIYLMLGGGMSKFNCPLDSLWIFPSIATLEAGAAPTITKWLQEALQENKIHGSYTGTSIRVGAVIEIGTSCMTHTPLIS